LLETFFGEANSHRCERVPYVELDDSSLAKVSMVYFLPDFQHGQEGDVAGFQNL
jgi:hypothetical protein